MDSSTLKNTAAGIKMIILFTPLVLLLSGLMVLTCPVLAMNAEQDFLIDRKGTDILFGKIGSAVKTKKTINDKNKSHNIFYPPTSKKVMFGFLDSVMH